MLFPTWYLIFLNSKNLENLLYFCCIFPHGILNGNVLINLESLNIKSVSLSTPESFAVLAKQDRMWLAFAMVSSYKGRPEEK